MGDKNQNQAREVMLPVSVRSREELDAAMERQYGKEVAQALQVSLKNQKEAATALHKAGMNGQTDKMMEMYGEHVRQFQIKENLNKKWYEKVWDGTKEVGKGLMNAVLWPFKAVGKAFYHHPILMSAATIGLLLWGFPYLLRGVGGLEQMLASAPAQKIIGFFKTLTGLGESLPAMADIPEVLPQM